MTLTEKKIRDLCSHYADWYPSVSQIRELIALAQPEPEPLEYWNAVEGWVKIDEVREHFDSVGCGTIYKTAGEGREPLYTTPPQRKPLTKEQRIQIVKDNTIQGYHGEYFDAWGIIDDVEAAHGIKENT